MRRKLVYLLTLLTFSSVAGAQDTLPRFSVMARGPGKILISWHNNFATVTQISIQRSVDSLKNFTTLLTVPDPRLPQNGVTDSKAPHPNFFYRLFIVLENGNYLFSKSQRPHADIAAVKPEQDDIDTDTDINLSKTDRQRIRFVQENSAIAQDNRQGKPQVNSPSRIRERPRLEIDKPIFVKRGDSVIGELPGNKIRAFRDSLLAKTRDTLVFVDGDTLTIKPFVAKEVYKASPWVFTGKYGNIHVSLPDAAARHYGVKFFDENNKLMFELSAIRDPTLILDKSNFLHSGWFRFELYDGEKLKEKNKLFIPKDF
ncbi:MAG TPA: hypothetical protein VK563_16215 [Puia sp.]|nr:hypothetical protein [Puia sp.]